MGVKTSDDDGGVISEINVTPLVDITLVLLIIFMVAAPMIMNQAIKVNLPKASTGKATDTTTVAITIKKSGKTYLNGKVVEPKALEDFLRAEARANKEVRAIVSADQEVSHGTVVSYLDLLNRCGISKYAVSVEKNQTAADKADASDKGAGGTPGAGGDKGAAADPGTGSDQRAAIDPGESGKK